MKDWNLPIFIESYEEWLDELFVKASIFICHEEREELKFIASQLLRGYLSLLEQGNALCLTFLDLLGCVNNAVWGVFCED